MLRSQTCTSMPDCRCGLGWTAAGDPPTSASGVLGWLMCGLTLCVSGTLSGLCSARRSSAASPRERDAQKEWGHAELLEGESHPKPLHTPVPLCRAHTLGSLLTVEALREWLLTVSEHTKTVCQMWPRVHSKWCGPNVLYVAC